VSFDLSSYMNIELSCNGNTSHLTNNAILCGAIVAGYWGLYLISVHLGYILNSKQTSIVQTTSPSSKNEEKRTVALRPGVVVGTWVLDAILW
jgi:hypothetical protein